MKRMAAVLIIVLAVFVPAAANAASYSVIKPTVRQGMLVSLSANSGVVEPTTEANASSLAGVVVPATAQTPSGQVEVSSDGQASALVSTLNGPIKVGDRITPTVLEGVGAKLQNVGWIVGTAQGSFDGKTSGAVATSVTDSQGNKHQVYVGNIPIAIRVTYFNDQTQSTNSIQSLADKIAGRHASLLGIIFSFVLLFVGLVIVGMTVFATIRGGYTAVSRQPLIRHFIVRSVALSFLVSALVMAAVFALAYLVLKFA